MSVRDHLNFSTNPKCYTTILALIFFVAMVTMEVLIEGTFYEFKSRASGSMISASITFSQFLACFLVPMIYRPQTISSLPTNLREIPPYIILTILVFGATALATASVQYVPYTVKIIFKSAKLIPTMIVASCMHSTSYGPREYISAALLCAGAMGYAYNPGNAADGDSSRRGVGIVMLIVSSFCDALVPNIQQKLMAKNISAEEVMVNTNLFGFACVTAYMLHSGGLSEMASLSKADPFFLLRLAGIGTCLSLAVMAYTSLIKKAGSVFAVSVGTLRKVITIGLSYLLFPKEFLPVHALASLSVVLGIVLEGWKAAKAPPAPAQTKEKDAESSSIQEKY